MFGGLGALEILGKKCKIPKKKREKKDEFMFRQPLRRIKMEMVSLKLPSRKSCGEEVTAFILLFSLPYDIEANERNKMLARVSIINGVGAKLKRKGSRAALDPDPLVLYKKPKWKSKCTSRESNPGLYRGRVLFYH